MECIVHRVPMRDPSDASEVLRLIVSRGAPALLPGMLASIASGGGAGSRGAAQERRAIKSASTMPPRARCVTPTVVRAGSRSGLKYVVGDRRQGAGQLPLVGVDPAAGLV